MVYYFTSNVVDPPGFIYVGKDKFENEDLIKFGWEEDICAHIYLRMQEGQAWDALPEELVMDLAQLTKANSIEGNKKDNVTVIYTPWSNLKKDGSMEVGQVGFKDPRKAAFQARKKEEARQAQEWKEKKWQKDHAYDDIFTEENMAGSSNQDRDENWEDDFM
ncbi:hypothetical protein ACJA88_001649 [Fusarium oxysporum]